MLGTAQALHQLYWASRAPMEITSTAAETVKTIENSVQAVDAAQITQDFRGAGLLRNLAGMAKGLDGAGPPMDFTGNLDAIASATKMPVDDVILAMTEQGILKQGNAGGEFMKALYEWGKQGGEVGKVINSSQITPDFLNYLQSQGNTGVLDIVKKFGAGAASGSPKFPGTILGVNPKAFLVGGPKYIAVATEVIKTVGVSATVKKGTLVLGKLGLASTPAAASVLSILGIGTIAMGASISLARYKGRKSSRLAGLEKLRGELTYFPDKVGEIIPPITPVPTPDPDPTPPGPTEGSPACQELLAKLQGFNLGPGDVVELNYAASRRVKLARKNEPIETEGGGYVKRKVMVTAIPGLETFNGYSNFSVVVPSYEDQCKDHPHWISLQIIDITRAGDPPSFSPIAEITKAAGVRQRMPKAMAEKTVMAGQKMPEDYSYMYNITNVDKSDESFESFLQEFKDQILDDNLKTKFVETFEAEMRKRRGTPGDEEEGTPDPGTPDPGTPDPGAPEEPTAEPAAGPAGAPAPRRRRGGRRRGLPRKRRLYREFNDKGDEMLVEEQYIKRWAKLVNIKGEE